MSLEIGGLPYSKMQFVTQHREKYFAVSRATQGFPALLSSLREISGMSHSWRVWGNFSITTYLAISNYFQMLKLDQLLSNFCSFISCNHSRSSMPAHPPLGIPAQEVFPFDHLPAEHACYPGKSWDNELIELPRSGKSFRNPCGKTVRCLQNVVQMEELKITKWESLR